MGHRSGLLNMMTSPRPLHDLRYAMLCVRARALLIHSLDFIGQVVFVVSSPPQRKPQAEDEEEDKAKHRTQRGADNHPRLGG